MYGYVVKVYYTQFLKCNLLRPHNMIGSGPFCNVFSFSHAIVILIVDLFQP